MKKLWSLSAFVSNAILLVLLIAVWIALAPANLGGKVSYVVVNGMSMEPGYHLGDLALMRRADTYQVGDVVTYHDADMQAHVIHRIIGIDQGSYILKGDNNSWIDSYRPTNDEIIGKLWIHIPGLGKTFEWLRVPLHMALTVGLFGGALMAGTVIKPSQRGKRKQVRSISFGGTLEGGLYLFGFLALVFLSLGIFAFIRPLTRPADKIQYRQESQFTYSATGTPVIYDTETVRSGEPVFPRLTCFLNIGFTYNAIGEELQAVSGSHQLIARVSDEQSGWQRTIPMTDRATFNGNSFATSSALDLCQIVSLVNVLKQETGLRATNFTLEIIPQVIMTALADGNQISDSFEPRLVFRFDEVHFSLSTPKGQEDPLYLSRESMAANSNILPNSISIPGAWISIASLRIIALVGFGVSLTGLLAFVWHLFKAARQNRETLIRLRYGSLMVNIYERDLQPTSTLIDVTTIDELAKLAERHNTVMLHMALNFLHSYFVQCNGITYRYIFSAGRQGVPEVEPPRGQVINYVSGNHQGSMRAMKQAEDEIVEYMIDNRRDIQIGASDSVLLQRIKL